MDMSANYIDISDDSDDVPLGVRIAARSTAAPPAAAPLDEPDWVRSFTPKRAPSPKGSDSDSLINLLLDDDHVPTQDAVSTQEVGSTQDNGDKKAKKRARTSKKPPKAELSLVASGKLDDSLALLQADGAELDLSGDVGAVGRVKVEDDGECILDIKGTLYSALPYHCNTAAVVSVMDDEARIGAVMNAAVVLKKCSNVFAADNGVLDGHTFDAGMEVEVEGQEEEGKQEDKEETKGQKGKKKNATGVANGTTKKGGAKKTAKTKSRTKTRK